MNDTISELPSNDLRSETMSNTPSSTSADPNNTTGLLSQLIGDVSGLVRSEMSLAKAEMNQSVTDAKTGLSSMAVGLAILVPGVTLLIAAIVMIIEAFTGLEAWSSTLLVGVIITAIGAVLLSTAKSKLSAENMLPSRTQASVQKDANLVEEKLS